MIENGKFEFLINRRLFYDDDRGVGEALNETDSFGNGIVVHAFFHLHFFDKTKEASV